MNTQSAFFRIARSYILVFVSLGVFCTACDYELIDDILDSPLTEDSVMQVSVELPFASGPSMAWVEVRNGIMYFEDDIILGPANTAFANFNAGNTLWPDGIMPYEIEEGHPGTANIMTAIDHINEKTNVQIVPRTQFPQRQYVIFRNKPGECTSVVGLFLFPSRLDQPSAQPINLDPFNCDAGAVVHEIGHALGFYHEHNRSDRDDYVTIQFGNIKPGQAPAFYKCNTCTYIGPYDYASTMHYRAYAHTRNGHPTIVSQIPGQLLGSPTGELSPGDIDGINTLYAGNTELNPVYVTIRSESSGDYSGQYLGVDPGTGKLSMYKVESDRTKWTLSGENRIQTQVQGAYSGWYLDISTTNGGVKVYDDPNHTGTLWNLTHHNGFSRITSNSSGDFNGWHLDISTTSGGVKVYPDPNHTGTRWSITQHY